MREKRNCQESQGWSRTRASGRSPIRCCRLGVGGESGLRESLRENVSVYWRGYAKNIHIDTSL